MDLVFSVALLITVFAVICTKWLMKFWRKAAPLPPGPRGVPILGYIPFIGTYPHLTLTYLASVYGPVYKIWLGNKMCLVLNSPAVVKEVVREKDTIFANRDSPIAVFISTYDGADVGFSDLGLEQSKLRKIFAQEMLSIAGLDACYSIRRDEVQKGIKEVYKKVGTPTDIGKTVLHTAINAAVGMVCGGTILENSQEWINIRQVLDELLEIIVMPNISDLFPAVAWLDLQGIAKRTGKLFSQIDQFYDRVIEHKRQLECKSKNVAGDGTKDLLQHLLELKHYKDVSSPSSSFTMTQLKALLQDIFLAATETTSTIVEWAISELLVHPQILQTVCQELNEVVGLNNIVEESHVHKLRYLQAVLKETHRLHPVVPFLAPRKPSETTTVSGYTIPKGSKVFINVWAIHRDPQFWESPLEFMPERFLDDSTKLDFSGNSLHYMPFGSGRRRCPGLPLADRFVPYLLASLLHSFDWQVPSGVMIDFKGQCGITLKKQIPLVAVPTPRHTNLELYA